MKKVVGLSILCFSILSVFSMTPVAAQDGGDDKVPVHFNGVELDLVIRQIQRFAGVKIIYDGNLMTNKKVTMLAPGVTVPKRDALEVLRRILHIHRLFLVRQPGELDSYTIVPESTLLKTPNPVFAQGDPKMPSGSEVVTQLFTLKHADANAVSVSLQGMSDMTNSIIPLASPGKIIVTGRAANVRRIGMIVAMLDTPRPAVKIVSYALEHARADKVKTKIEAMMKALRGSAGVRAGRGRQGPAMPIMINERTNAVIVFAAGEVHNHVAALVKQLDTKNRHVRRVKIYKIKNAEAAAVAYMLGELLDADVAGGFAGIRSPGGGDDSGTGSQIPSTGRLSKRRGTGKEAETFGREVPLVIPDLNQNALLVRTTDEMHKEVARIISDLDARRPQVLIEVAIVEVSDDDETDIGVELMSFNRRGTNTRFFGSTDFSLGDTSFNPITGLPAGKVLKQIPGVLAGLTSRDQLPVLLHALKTKTKAKILSTPTLLVNDNEHAEFVNSFSEPTTRTSQGETTTEVSFGGFESAELSLSITPLISEGGYITLRIEQKSESFVGKSAALGIPPQRASTRIQTVVTVPNDETVIIGGLTVSKEEETVTSVPFLGDIPILGELFKSRERVVRDSKIYIFIRPLILADPNFKDLKKASRRRARDLKKSSGLDIGKSDKDEKSSKPGADKPDQ